MPNIKFPNQLILATLLLVTMKMHLSCKKEGPQPPRNNEIKATITFSSGEVLTTRTSGWNAAMGCSFLVPGSWINSKDEINGALSFTYSGACVTAPTTVDDQLFFQYTRHPNSSTSPGYHNSTFRLHDSSQVSSGSVTFTSVQGNIWEGHFNAVCWASPTDSVIIKGTFKGEKRE